MNVTLTDAVALAEFAHRNQFDKAGLPYIEHPKRVLAAVQAQGARPFVQMAAVMHDVVEDTPFTLEMLQEFGFSEAVTGLVNLLTRKKDESPDIYYAYIKANPEARMIKLADIGDNTQPWRLSYLDDATVARLTKKYESARLALQ